MRIISGKFKGHKLIAFSASNIRPTTDRVKESVFNKLAGDIDGARVLDLFSGTGALALEALSRGARDVVAVENHPKSLKIISENLRKLKIETGLKVVSFDVFKFLARYEGEPFDLILADPPFTQKLAHQVMTALAASRAVVSGTQIMIESGAHEHLDDSYPPLVFTDRRDYGDKVVSFFTCP